LYDVCKAIARVLVELGRGKHSEPTTFTDEEASEYLVWILIRIDLG
jgi:hypothetical protein